MIYDQLTNYEDSPSLTQGAFYQKYQWNDCVTLNQFSEGKAIICH